MTELHELLDRRARSMHPSSHALDAVLRRARRRERRRRAVAGGAVIAVTMTLLTGVLDTRLPGGPTQALGVRQDLGIFGSTKEAGDAVLVRNTTAQGHPQISLIPLDPAKSTPFPIGEAKDATVSPKGEVAAVTQNDGVVVVNPTSGSKSQVLEPGPKPSPPSVSWDSTGNILFALVSGRWLEVRNPGTARSQTRTLNVPALSGEPTVLSISPSGSRAILFGVVTEASGAVPHLYLGTFDGTSVGGVRTIDVPRGARGGPLGWLGDNAFLLAPAPGQALIVRTDGTTVPVYAQGIADPCSTIAGVEGCLYRGPRLMGTNDDGSLLFWRVAAVRGGRGGVATFLVRYYRTWLDGTHALRLTGLTGMYGPAVAPR